MVHTVNELLVHATAKIVKIVGGVPVESGTGFFWNASSEPNLLTLGLRTNKHVLHGADSIQIRCHLAKDENCSEPSGQFIDYHMLIKTGDLINHPDPSVDLCSVGLGDLVLELRSRGQYIFCCTLNESMIPDEQQWKDFDAIEDVIMVGYPSGLADDYNNRPLVRRGVSATQIGKKYNGKPEFLVDMACYPGSSGSPIFIHQNSFFDKSLNNFVISGQRFFFVGILYAGPTINNRGVINFINRPTFEMSSMMHLGNVIESREVLIMNQMIRNITKKIDI